MGTDIRVETGGPVWRQGDGKIWRWHVIAGLCLSNGLRYGAELGVSHGRFTSFLCSTMPEMLMLAVDLWAPQPERDLAGAESYAEWSHEERYQNFTRHCAAAFPRRVTIMRCSTLQAAGCIENGVLDFVFIDADHTYEGTKADICAWTPKVRAGGLISGHDYNWPSVRQAVDEMIAAPQLGHDNVWYTQK